MICGKCLEIMEPMCNKCGACCGCCTCVMSELFAEIKAIYPEAKHIAIIGWDEFEIELHFETGHPMTQAEFNTGSATYNWFDKVIRYVEENQVVNGNYS